MEFRINLNNVNFKCYDFKFNNIILELNGDYFHANPCIYKPTDIIKIRHVNYLAIDIWNKDLEKKQLAEDNGYIVKYLWEYNLKRMTDTDILTWIKTNCII